MQRSFSTFTVGHCLNEDGAILFEGNFAGLCSGIVNGPNIVAVHANGPHSIAGSPRSNAIAAELIAGGCTDSIAVVAAEKDDGGFQSSSKVKSSMEIALAGSAFAKVTHCNSVCVGPLQCVSSTGGLFNR